MLEEGSAKPAAVITNKKFNDIGTAEVLVTADNDNENKLIIMKECHNHADIVL